MEGVVKFFDLKRHYGFIQLLDETGDAVFGEYFFSKNDVIGDLPEKGDRVQFLLDDPPSRAQRRDLIAVKVEKLKPAYSATFAADVFEKLSADEELAHAC